jgi:hypothetical protein
VDFARKDPVDFCVNNFARTIFVFFLRRNTVEDRHTTPSSAFRKTERGQSVDKLYFARLRAHHHHHHHPTQILRIHTISPLRFNETHARFAQISPYVLESYKSAVRSKPHICGSIPPTSPPAPHVRRHGASQPASQPAYYAIIPRTHAKKPRAPSSAHGRAPFHGNR